MAAIFIIIWAGLTYRLLKTGFDMGFETIWIFALVLFIQVSCSGREERFTDFQKARKRGSIVQIIASTNKKCGNTSL